MPGMKRDCGGAAAILGAFYSAVKAGFTQNLHAVFCLAENAVGPGSTRYGLQGNFDNNAIAS